MCVRVCWRTFLSTVFSSFWDSKIQEEKFGQNENGIIFFGRPERFVCVRMWVRVHLYSCTKNVIVASYNLSRKMHEMLCMCSWLYYAFPTHVENLSMNDTGMTFLFLSTQNYHISRWNWGVCVWWFFIAWKTPKIDTLYFWSMRRNIAL